jgi:hypothetical protein
VLRDGAIRPLAGGRLAVELLVGQADQSADEPRPLGEPLGEKPMHRRRGDPGLVAPLEHLACMDLLVIDVVRQERPHVFPLGAGVRRGHRQLALGCREQRVDRRHGLLEKLTNRTAHSCRHVVPP